MKSSHYVKDVPRVKAALRVVGEQIVAVKPLKIQIPARFPQRNLAVFESETTVVGICAFIVEDKYYAASVLCAPFRTEPSLVGKQMVDDVEYIEMVYEVGAVVVSNINLVKIDSLVYKIYDEFEAKGRVPWYIGYETLAGLFTTSPYHAGVTVGSNSAVHQLVSSTICRSPDNPKIYYRQALSSREDMERIKPTVIALRAVSYGATNAIAKILGSFFDENVTSALVYPSDRVEKVESLLRI